MCFSEIVFNEVPVNSRFLWNRAITYWTAVCVFGYGLRQRFPPLWRWSFILAPHLTLQSNTKTKQHFICHCIAFQ